MSYDDRGKKEECGGLGGVGEINGGAGCGRRAGEDQVSVRGERRGSKWAARCLMELGEKTGLRGAGAAWMGGPLPAANK